VRGCATVGDGAALLLQRHTPQQLRRLLVASRAIVALGEMALALLSRQSSTGLALLAAEPVGRAASTGKRVAASLFVFSRAGGAGADPAVSPTFSSAFEMGLNLLTNKVYIDIRHIYICVSYNVMLSE